MIINQGTLGTLFAGYKAAFQKGGAAVPTYKAEIATVVPSTAGENIYPWLGQFPAMREWIGDRIVRNLALHGTTITNRKFEQTISVPRDTIEDDQYGVFAPMFEEMGRTSTEHPDELLFGLLAQGFTLPCYDGQNFFDADHPVGVNGGDYPIRSVSNMQAGSNAPWFLMDCSRAIKPLIFQERTPYDLTKLDQDNDPNVFFRDEYIYGVRARANSGFGLWQLAFGSKAALDATNYNAARVAMRELRGDEGRPLAVRPTHLVVPPSLEAAGRQLLENEMRVVESGGGSVTAVSNEWKGTAKLIVSEWLSAA